MIFYIVVLGATVAVVYGVKKMPVNHSWKIAIGTGVATSLILSMVVISFLDLEISIVGVLGGNILAAIAGFIVEFLFLGVNYAKTEIVEFEDDDYHYYVKAVPKLGEKAPSTRKRRREEREEHVEEYVEEYTDDYRNGYDDGYAEEYQNSYDDGYAEQYQNGYGGYTPSQELSERDRYEADVDELLENEATMVINSEEIERELRSNAHEKAMKQNKERHAKTNLKMLRESMKKKS